MKIHDFKDNNLPKDFFWFNEPKSYSFEHGLCITTKNKTDFWQRTHYGFKPDSGHCLLTEINGDFSIETEVTFKPIHQYDQCGLFIRIDSDNWIKCSTEYENTKISRLGSVVTNLGYSDWATQDISSENSSMFYKISRRNDDFLIENSYDGEKWFQMRVCHLHALNNKPVSAGIYTCSPLGEDFVSEFEYIKIDNNHWFSE